MIVKKQIGSIKIGNTVSRLTVGKPVPENVLAYWKKTNQYEELKKAGIIGDAESTVKQASTPDKPAENSFMKSDKK